MDRVTKTKHPGRVASGKRLAEWRRKNKENLVKNKEQVESSNLSSDQQVESSNLSSATSNTTLYGGVSVAVALAGIAVFFLWKRNTPNPTPQPVAKPEDDIFRMN